MSNESKTKGEKSDLIPIGQKMLDSPFLLLTAGIVVMFVFYTLWGLYEVLFLPKGTLP
ncbi:MAG: hypothetical protein OEV66_01825 [Spirochaetia bacterium]|nr:hypothetical protein [Spirochaetia bacterium]